MRKRRDKLFMWEMIQWDQLDELNQAYEETIEHGDASDFSKYKVIPEEQRIQLEGNFIFDLLYY